MKNYDEIKSIITEKLGFTSLDKYEAVAHGPRRKEALTEEELTQLSPDHVNNTDFWRVAGELFGADPICNQKVRTPSILEANRRNLMMSRMSGCLGWVDGLLHQAPQSNVLEIGTGYGNFRNYIETTHKHATYFGIDTMPRHPDVRVTEPDGTMPRELVKPNVIGVLYSSNVFQHLSSRQRSQYFKDASELVEDNGGLIFNLLTVPDGHVQTEGNFDCNGRGYLGHYGQWTIVPTFNEVLEELRANNFWLYAHQIRQEDGLTSFLALRKERAKPVEVKEEAPTS